MPTNIYLDCDDTLALYCYFDCGHDEHPFGALSMPWYPNEPLIAGVKAFRATNPDALIVVWSGGGKDYARTFAERLLPGIYDTTMDKWGDALKLPRPGDIVVDDCVIITAGTHYLPDEWPDGG